LRELVISLEGATLVMRVLSRDYFVVLALASHGNLGRARFEMRKTELKLAKEFAV
jgi:predicted regulator of Ras-like GTPase activity (Roadblock/LC7/MglB family)